MAYIFSYILCLTKFFSLIISGIGENNPNNPIKSIGLLGLNISLSYIWAMKWDLPLEGEGRKMKMREILPNPFWVLVRQNEKGMKRKFQVTHFYYSSRVCCSKQRIYFICPASGMSGSFNDFQINK